MKVLVVVARGLQAGAVGAYGNPWIDTPALDALAAAGVVFDQHFAGRADAAGARRAFRTGRYDLPTPPDVPVPPPGDDLLRRLHDRGIATSLIVDASRPGPASFAQGWQAEEADALERVLDAAGAALEQFEGRGDWLLWVELATLLPPWDVPEEFQKPYFEEEPPADDEDDEGEEAELGEDEEDEPLTPLREVQPGPIDPSDDTLYLRLHTSYAAAVSYLDAGLGQLLEALSGMEGSDEVVVLVTTDCGQALGEHGVVAGEGPWPHDEVIHLPLILRLPGGLEAGRRIAALTQTVDVAVTLADLFGVALDAAHGHSLLPLARGEVEEVRPYACAGVEAAGVVTWVLRTPAWALLLPWPDAEGVASTVELYVKPDDRWEVNNVVQHHQEWAERLEQVLRAFLAAARQAGPLQVPPLPKSDAPPSV